MSMFAHTKPSPPVTHTHRLPGALPGLNNLYPRKFSGKLLAAISLLALTTVTAYATTPVIPVAQTPLILSKSAEPNIIMGIDDSGSMDFEVLAPTNDGAYWWNTSQKSFVGCDVNDHCVAPPSDTFNFNEAGGFGGGSVWNKYAYLFPFPGLHDRNGGYNSKSDQGHYFIPPIPAFAWARSAQYNDAYFDPTVTYVPWENSDGTHFANMSPTAAIDDPYTPIGHTATVNLTLNLQGSGFCFMLQPGMTLPKGAVVDNLNGSAGWQTLASPVAITSEQCDDIAYFPATFWIQSDNVADAIAAAGAGFSSYSASAVITGGSGPDNEPMFGFQIQPANFADSAQYTAAIQNFANWFSYYRRRHLALRASLSQSFAGLANVRVGITFMNNLSAVTMYDMNSTTDRAALFSKFLNDSGSGGTPTWQMLQFMGQQYQRTNAGAPITQACQKNFGIVFTDGYANYPYPYSLTSGSGVGNADGSAGSPYADTESNTLGDLAYSFYNTNLRPNLTAGLVTPDPGCGGPGASVLLDCNTNLHMDTYAVTLVQQGLIWNVNVPATTNPVTNPPPWPAPSAFANRNPTGIDDLWHATLDSRGQMFAAKTPQLIAAELQQALNSIAARSGSAASVAANSTHLQTNTDIFQAQFHTIDWSGSLQAFAIDPTNGSIATTATWDAAKLIPAAASRVIATWDPSAGKGVPFEWGSINATQQTDLNTNPQPPNNVDNLGQDRLTWLRGGAAPAGDGFRTRSTPLGDIVDSNPLFVGPPNGPYQDPSYISFEKTEASRPAMLYVGANDGMLHAIDPVTGIEKFAFVPDGVFANLNKLTSPVYNSQHQFFVDGSPTSGDVQFSDGSWHSILVGGLNAGGNSIYALDVTDPAAITSESTLAADVMWEYSDPSGLLGLTYSQPFIARTSVTGSKFVVFFGSGYDNSDGNPYLYAVNAQTGALLARINLCASVSPNPCDSSLPNGLSSPVAVNSGGALYLPDDTVYAGDLQGNLWKVDISDANPANWKVQLLFQARDSSGNPQPITVAPVVSLNPEFPAYSGPIVYFGTGQLLGLPDLATTGTQTFYGVWDKPGLTAVLTRSNLQVQTLSGPTAGPGGTTVRTVTKNKVNWANQYGWYEDLPVSGERVVADPRLENGAVVFTTYVPTTEICAVGGQAWLMAVNFATGGSFPSPELDLNGDGHLNSGDETASGDNPAGVDLGAVYAAAPTIISANLGQIQAVKLVSESNGTIRSVGQHGFGTARQSWREVPSGN